MIPIKDIATILRDSGYPVRQTKTRGYVDDTLFTGEYARFGKNPNLYYYKKQNSTAAAAFIEEGMTTLSWSDEEPPHPQLRGRHPHRRAGPCGRSH